MIGWINGTILQKTPPVVLLNVNGIGYELEAPMTTFYRLPETGAGVALFTHQIIREDGHHLYAFSNENERDVFRMLLRVNGVGAKLGLAILSGMDAQAFTQCVYDGDTVALAKLPGIGKKTAERLVLEMRDRLNRAPTRDAGGLTSKGVLSNQAIKDPSAEAISALESLGLKNQEATRRVRAIDCEGLKCEDIVRLALQQLVR